MIKYLNLTVLDINLYDLPDFAPTSRLKRSYQKVPFKAPIARRGSGILRLATSREEYEKRNRKGGVVVKRAVNTFATISCSGQQCDGIGAENRKLHTTRAKWCQRHTA